jgi:hypothetical protein
MHIRLTKTWMLCNAYDDMASFSYHNTRGVTCNTLRPATLWIVLIVYQMNWGGSLPALYSMGGKVIDLRNLSLISYNNHIHMGYEIYPNRPGSLDHQVGLSISRVVRRSVGWSAWPILTSWANSFGVAHVQPWGYMGLYPHSPIGQRLLPTSVSHCLWESISIVDQGRFIQQWSRELMLINDVVIPCPLLHLGLYKDA